MPVQATALLCPRDQHELTPQLVEGVTIDACGACGGTWFDHRELRRVSHDKELEQLALRTRRSAEETDATCPRCQAACHEAWIADIPVDACHQCHGLWLDRGELQEAKRQVETQRLLDGRGEGFRAFLRRL